MITTSARTVARYLLWLALHECEDEPSYLTPLQLQKLLYYCQGWALAEWGVPLFTDEIQAWRDGPVVPAVYQTYPGREKKPIEPESADMPAELTESERALVHAVWDAYKRHSGLALRDMTHAEEPYLATYTSEDREGRCSRVIDRDLLKRSFDARGRLSRLKDPARRAALGRLARETTRRLTGRDVL